MACISYVVKFKGKLSNSYIRGVALYGAETWTLRKADQKCLGSFEMWRWRKTEKTIWTDRVRNEEVLYRVKQERNYLQTIKRRKANWIGYILRRNCLIKHVCLFVVCFPGVTTHCGCIFHSPVTGFNRLVFEVSGSHTTTRHSR